MSPDDRRQAILDAVIPLLIETGEPPSTKQIAEAAGVAEGTIFRVFDDKPSLMRAVAEEALSPADGRAAFEAALADVDDLRERVRVASEALRVQMNRAMQVMLAVRSYLVGQPHEHGVQRPGPPQFIVDANQDLHEMLTWLFEPHRAHLRVPPETAALVLRSIVFGSRHPWIDSAPSLTPEDIADIIVGGVAVPLDSVEKAEPTEKVGL